MKKFAVKILDRTVQIRRASYPESQQFNILEMELRKTDVKELVELLKDVLDTLS
jgi:hypothetical protein